MPLVAIGIVVLAGQAAVAVAGLANGVPAVHVAVICWLTASYTISGLIAWHARPANPFGRLMVRTGLLAAVSGLSWLPQPVPHTIGQAVDLLPLVLIVHVFLSFPTGRPRQRWLLGIGYAAALGVHLVAMALGALQPHLLVVTERQPLADLLYQGELLIVSAVALVAAFFLIARPRFFVLLLHTFTAGLMMIAVLLVVGVFGGPAFPVVQRLAIVLVGLAPMAFLAGLLRQRLARGAVGDLVLELRGDPADLRTPLAKALRDSSLRLLYWLPSFDAWADEDGRAAELPGDPTRVTTIEDEGAVVAALVHDPALRDEPALLDAVTAAAAIALRTGRLQAQLRANVAELRGSRARAAEAEQRERQRLERDLHDGAQQRLVALSLHLGVLQTEVDPALADSLRVARTEIAVSLEELRDIARGLHPAVVSAHGLAVALESLVARATVPVRLTVELPSRAAEAVEVAAYYVVCECLTNVEKHASASAATVTVGLEGESMVIEVADDGCGGADAERGSGLRGLADRVETLGGRLRVWTPSGRGTRVRAELPCGPAAEPPCGPAAEPPCG